MTKLIAHRGLKLNGIKENSIEAIKSALKNPHYVGFECDIRTTLDKHFVINHNPIIKNDLISKKTLKELQNKYHLSTLEEILSIKSDKIFLLEIKEVDLDIDSFLKIILKYPSKKIYIMSFHNSIIKKLIKKDRSYKLGVLNYVLNSEEDYHNYDFICLLETIASEKLINYFETKKIETFIYGIHHFDSTVSTYKNSYLITDKIIM